MNKPLKYVNVQSLPDNAYDTFLLEVKGLKTHYESLLSRLGPNLALNIITVSVASFLVDRLKVEDMLLGVEVFHDCLKKNVEAFIENRSKEC